MGASPRRDLVTASRWVGADTQAIPGFGCEHRGMRSAPSALELEIHEEIAEGESPNHPIRRWLAGIREKVAQRPHVNLAYRILVATLGTIIVLVGIVLIPLPGPGWLIVFLGLAVLGTEFHWARRLMVFAKRQLSRFWAWWNARRARRAARVE